MEKKNFKKQQNKKHKNLKYQICLIFLCMYISKKYT